MFKTWDERVAMFLASAAVLALAAPTARVVDVASPPGRSVFFLTKIGLPIPKEATEETPRHRKTVFDFLLFFVLGSL